MPPAKAKKDRTAKKPARYYTIGPQVRAWIEATCRHTKGRAFAGRPVIFEPFQSEFIDELFLRDAKTHLPVYSSALWGLPTKNGKSTSASTLAIDGLAGPWADYSPEVYVAAMSRRQAGVIGETVAAMIKGGPLARYLDVQTHLIRRPAPKDDPADIGIFRALAAEAGAVHGVSPSRTIYDELGQAKNQELLAALEKSTGAREDALTLTITHWGIERHGPLGGIYDRALALPDVRVRYTDGVESVVWARDRENGFLMAWHGILDDHRDRVDDPAVWKACNPASWITEDFLRKQRGKASMREADFIRYHLNGAVTELNAWLPGGLWQQLADPKLVLERGADAWLGVDAAVKHDSSALVIDVPVRVTLTPAGLIVPHGSAPGEGRWLHQLEAIIFEPGDHGTGMIEMLEITIRRVCKLYRVRAVAYDPWRFHRSAIELESEGIPMVEFPQNHERMVPASQRFYELANEHLLRHDGSRDFALHVTNATVRETARGWRIDKAKARHKIDAAVAGVQAVKTADDMLNAGGGRPTRFRKIT